MTEEEIKEDEAAREAAIKLYYAGVKVSLHSVRYYSAYCQALREAYEKLFPQIIASLRGDEKVYKKAEYDLCMSCMNACDDYHVGTYRRCYKDHVRDKKGKLIKCTAYFYKETTIKTEIKYGKDNINV